MKVVLDLDELRASGKITPEEYTRLLELSAHATGSLAFNILIGFGVIAVSGGTVALVPSPLTALVIGILVGVAGFLVNRHAAQSWGVLGTIAILNSALLVGGAILALNEGSLMGVLVVSIVFALGALLAKSGLLTSLSLLGFSAILGAKTAYWHATYSIGTNRPFLTIIAFSALGIGFYLFSKRLPPAYERLALIGARTCVLLANLGFWIGSLWGDAVSERLEIGEGPFSAAWALTLIGVGVWAARENRRWVVNTCATFGAIHFYTQYFEAIGASPVTILVAGLAAIGIAIGIWKYNRSATPAPVN